MLSPTLWFTWKPKARLQTVMRLDLEQVHLCTPDCFPWKEVAHSFLFFTC